jgi:hypothetical protein
MIDIGVEITPGPQGTGTVLAVPGRITKVLPDSRACAARAPSTTASSKAERGGKAPGYTGDAKIPDPAVVTLNGTVASAAATEVLQLITAPMPDMPSEGSRKLGSYQTRAADV